jgi:hypothetical protein
MNRRCRKHCFTIIELLVALSLMAVIAGGLVLGVTRSVRATQLKTSKERIERMFLQAFRFAAVSGHVGEVVIRREEDGAFEGYINLWEIGSRNITILAQRCVSIGRLSGIESISLNGCPVHRATFRFFGGYGLSTVCAYDQYQRELVPSDFGFSPENLTHKKRELEVVLRHTQNSDNGEKISLHPYLLSIPDHLSFPDEYLTIGL